MRLWLRLMAASIVVGFILSQIVNYDLGRRGSPFAGLVHPPKIEPIFIVDPKPIDKVDPEPADFFETIQAALRAGRYADLDAMAARYRAPDALFIGGIPKLDRFYDALAAFGPPPKGGGCCCPPGSVATPPGFVQAEQRLEAWRNADPTSSAADLALANIWLDSAWDARGGGYADKVTDAQWMEVGKRLSQAEFYLIDPDPTKDPEVLYLRLAIGSLRGYDRSRFADLYRRATTRFPTYYPFYAERASELEPKWFGAPGELAAYLDDLRRPEHGETGQVAYSFAANRLMADYERSDLFTKIGLYFPAVIQAYQTRERLYGLRNHDWNAIFNLSIEGGDCHTGHVALQQIGDRWDPSVWGTRAFFNETVAWFHAHSAY